MVLISKAVKYQVSFERIEFSCKMSRPANAFKGHIETYWSQSFKQLKGEMARTSEVASNMSSTVHSIRKMW
jgi:hypothetical protein